MAKVMVTLRVMPVDTSVNLDSLLERIREKTKIDRAEKEPIAFGLTALKLITLVEEKAGAVEELENAIKSVEGVGQVEVLSVSRSYI